MAGDPINDDTAPEVTTTTNGNQGNTWEMLADGKDMVDEVEVIHEEGDEKWFNFKTFLSYTGPGFLMCIAYLDPGNLEADLQVGAYTGYSLIWLLFAATFMGLVLQCMAARLGVVTGKNLARICKENYSRPCSFTLWVMTEIAIIGCDLQEIIGSAIAFEVLFGLPLWVGCLITFLDTFTFLGIHYFGVRKLEGLFVVLVSIMTICFFINFGKNPPPSDEILYGFVPQMHKYAVQEAVGLIGAVIMPHNIFLHSALVLSRKIDRSNPRQVKEANKYFAFDSAFALFVSFLINLAVVSVFAYHFFDPYCAAIPKHTSACIDLASSAADGMTSYGSCNNGLGQCQEIGLAQAHGALAGVLGSAAKYIWAIGLLAAGQSSTMTGTYAGQYVMEGFLDLQIPVWQRVTFTRLLAIGPGLLVAILTQNNENLSDKFQEWINIIQSIQLTFALLPVLHFTSRKDIMGIHVNSRALTVLIWVMAFVVLVINMYLVIGRVADAQPGLWAYILVGIVGVGYLAFSASLVYDDMVEAVDYLLKRTRKNDQPKELLSPLLGEEEQADP